VQRDEKIRDVEGNTQQKDEKKDGV